MTEFDIGGGAEATGPPADTLPGAIEKEAARIIGETIMVDSPAEVNGGYCRQAAEAAVRRAAPVTESPMALMRGWQGMGSRHFFVRLDGMYHDPQRPGGVPDIRDLPFFSGEPHDVEVVATY